jgi:hypothetical protein
MVRKGKWKYNRERTKQNIALNEKRATGKFDSPDRKIIWLNGFKGDKLEP